MSPQRRIRIIVNPSAHSGRANRDLARAGLRHREIRGVALEWVESRSSEHLAELVRGAQEEELAACALAGGDGTVTLAINALDGKNRVPLAFLPVGSGNDFAKDIGVPRDLRTAFGLLETGVPRLVDLGRVLPGNQRFCCVASVGLDELALRLIYASWLPRSKFLNVLSSLRALVAYRPRAVRVTWNDSHRFEGEMMFAAVTNTRSYGGGFMVSPAARVDDGRLDLCIVKRTGAMRLLSQFPRILRGTHDAMPEVILASVNAVRIEALGDALPVPLDGELGMASSPVELRCEPASLRVLAPRSEARVVS